MVSQQTTGQKKSRKGRRGKCNQECQRAGCSLVYPGEMSTIRLEGQVPRALTSTDTRSRCGPGARELITNQTLGKAQVALEKQVGKEPFRGDGQEQKTHTN